MTVSLQPHTSLWPGPKTGPRSLKELWRVVLNSCRGSTFQGLVNPFQLVQVLILGQLNFGTGFLDTHRLIFPSLSY